MFTSPFLLTQYPGVLSQGWDKIQLAFSRSFSFSFSFSRSFSSFPQCRRIEYHGWICSTLKHRRTKAPRAFWNLPRPLTFPLSLLSLLQPSLQLRACAFEIPCCKGEPSKTHALRICSWSKGAPATVLTFWWTPKLHISSPEPGGKIEVTQAPPLRVEVSPPDIQHLADGAVQVQPQNQLLEGRRRRVTKAVCRMWSGAQGAGASTSLFSGFFLPPLHQPGKDKKKASVSGLSGLEPRLARHSSSSLRRCS